MQTSAKPVRGQSTRPQLYGIVLVAGGAIGAGMFALPLVAAGPWFLWSLLGLLMIWLATYYASLMLLEVNLGFKPGSSFHSIVAARLGRWWALANNLSIAFIMYILMYAYITAGASIIEQTLGGLISVSKLPDQATLSVLFAALITVITWAGTTMVGRISTLLLVGMVFSFTLACAGMLPYVDRDTLFSMESNQLSFISYLWVALPVFVTAFACAGLVPSLVKHYQADALKITRSLKYGTLLALLIYVFWLTATLGTLSRSGMATVIQAGGNLAELVQGLQMAGASTSINRALNYFSHLAIITSFLSIGIGLFHFVADRFNFSDKATARAKAALLTFFPPALMSFFFPKGFVIAIGYASLLVMFSFFLVPALMLLRQRVSQSEQRDGKRQRIVPRNRFLIVLILLFSLTVASMKMLSTGGLLPSFP